MAAGGVTSTKKQASTAKPMNGPQAAKARGAAASPPTPGGPARSLPSARMRLHVDQVKIGTRLRPLNPAKVEALIVSYEETGALPPILTRPHDLSGDLPVVMLVAGLHRLEACRRMGVPVDAMVREMTDAEALLTEVDENLLGPDLSPLDRAVFINARLEAWAAKYPDRATAADGQIAPKRGRPSKSAKFAHFSMGMGFTEETAGEIGLSKRSVEQSLAVYRGLAPAVRAKLPGTWIARSEGVLRQLANVADKTEQAGVLEHLLKGETKSVANAMALNAGNQPIQKAATPADAWMAAFEKHWKGAPATHKALALQWLQGQALPGGFKVKREGGDAQ
ncbi:MAG: ParB/RepB/Spo0J family partition protein [Caulobacter sp.]